jgi:ABC-type multidrug transport system fused ATPase/permease subunit
MRFDSNLAWKDAVQAVSANRDVLLALAGVFFMLPSLAFALLVPQPDPQPGLTPQQTLAVMGEFYSTAMPYMLVMSLIQAVGTLSVLTLFTDRTKPTVGEAIGLGIGGILPYLGAYVLIGLGLGLVGGILIGGAAAAGVPVLAIVFGLGLLIAAIYIGIRMSLIAPVVAVDRIRNPIEALRRSWELTHGNTGRILLFFVLLGVAFAVVLMVIMAVIGLILTLVAGFEAAKMIAAVISSLLTAVMTLYFIAVMASIHRQLSGPSAGAISATFD